MEKETAAAAPIGRGRPGPSPGRRARLVAFVAALALAGIAAGVIASVASSGSAAGPATAGSARVTSASPAVFRRALVARLRAQRADFQWVVCIRTGRRYEGAAIVRCNVEFGEPHVQAYCSVFRDGRLVTSQDDRAIPCAPDDAGFSAPIHTYS